MTLTKRIFNKLALLALVGMMTGASQAADNIGFVYVSPIGDAGWTFQHDLGRLQLEKEAGVTTSYVENVPEGPDAERVIREMAKRGDKVVFATSFGYMNYALKVSKSFRKTAFVHATGYKLGKNMGLVNARFYEGRYLTGVIAGEMTKSNVLGYVAAFPIPEVMQGINAFIQCQSEGRTARDLGEFMVRPGQGAPGGPDPVVAGSRRDHPSYRFDRGGSGGRGSG